MATSSVTTQAGDLLDDALRLHRPTRPVRDLIGADAIDAAYAVQRDLSKRRLVRGARIVGRKIGLTSPAVQTQLGVDEPDFGVLFDDMSVAPGGTIDTDGLIAPRVEAELAFILGADLPVDTDVERAASAVSTVAAALEIVDSRVRDWDITIADTVADNGSAALFVLGSERSDLDRIVPADVTMSLTVDGEVRSTGDGRACLGDPLLALAWLARTAATIGDPLQAGDIVLSGALGPMVAIGGGEHVTATIDPFPTVDVHFSPRSHEGKSQ